MYCILKAGVLICANISKPLNERYEYLLHGCLSNQLLFRKVIFTIFSWCKLYDGTFVAVVLNWFKNFKMNLWTYWLNHTLNAQMKPRTRCQQKIYNNLCNVWPNKQPWGINAFDNQINISHKMFIFFIWLKYKNDDEMALSSKRSYSIK